MHISVWTKSDLQTLLRQAEDFLEHSSPHSGFKRLKYITRDKDPQYFSNIFENRNGIMEKYAKDKYGNPECPINDKLDGLFFRAVVDNITGEPFPDSPYGSKRLQLPAEHLITPEKHLYLADFYCMYGRRSNKVNNHHVSLVLCELGSDSDIFCDNVLPRLDIRNNMFLYIAQDGNVRVTQGRRGGVYVEILYTEDMDISDLQDRFMDVRYFSGGRFPNPRKNKACPHCNLTERWLSTY